RPPPRNPMVLPEICVARIEDASQAYQVPLGKTMARGKILPGEDLVPVLPSAAGSIEVPTWAPVTPWPIAATSLPARAAPIPISHDPVAVGDALGFLKHGLSREVDPPLAIDLGDFDVDLIADIHGVLHPLHPVLGQLADVDQAILVGHDLDEGAEGHDAHHLALVILADLDLAGQVANDLLCLSRRLA